MVQQHESFVFLPSSQVPAQSAAKEPCPRLHRSSIGEGGCERAVSIHHTFKISWRRGVGVTDGGFVRGEYGGGGMERHSYLHDQHHPRVQMWHYVVPGPQKECAHCLIYSLVTHFLWDWRLS